MSLSLVRRAGALLALAVLPLAAQAPSHVILVTLDGVRTQEFFGGLDTLVLNGTERQHNVGDPAALRRRWWRPTPEERRRLLMPFFWDSLAPKGLVLGNVARGNQVLIQNRMRFSACRRYGSPISKARASATRAASMWARSRPLKPMIKAGRAG